ncbi:MAG: NAD-dependent epimerase/dehydratase family protein, partial [Planctomycetaceae bacterium]
MSRALENKRIVISGGSGFLGVSLAHHLADRGASVVILSRNPPKATGPWRHLSWDGRTLGSWRDELNEAAGLVNLAGRSVDCIKTPDHQDEILRSRVESTQVLGEALRSLDSPPPAWVQMSTAHIYGDPPKLVCTEESAFGYGLAPSVGRAWEEAFHSSVLPSQRGVVLRTSFVLGRNRGAGAGALDTLGMLARVGLGGKVGDGTQGMSWIHEADLNRLFERGLTDSTMQGAYIASAPHPVSQSDFGRELRRAVGMP